MRLCPLSNKLAPLIAFFVLGGSAHGGGYLARVGPVPIRFASQRSLSDQVFILPPLDSALVVPVAAPAPEPATNTMARAEVKPPVETKPPRPPATVVPLVVAPEKENGLEAGAPPDPLKERGADDLSAPGGGVVNVQGLMRYFKNSTNAGQPSTKTVIGVGAAIPAQPGGKSSSTSVSNKEAGDEK